MVSKMHNQMIKDNYNNSDVDEIPNLENINFKNMKIN